MNIDNIAMNTSVQSNRTIGIGNKHAVKPVHDPIRKLMTYAVLHANMRLRAGYATGEYTICRT